MLKKIFFTLIIIAIILIAVLLWLFYSKQKTNPEITFTESVKEFFPFGQPSTNIGGFPNNTATSTENNGTVENPDTNNTTGEVSKIPRLRQLTKTPTSGAVIVEREKNIVEGEGKNQIKKKITEYFVRYMYRGNGHIEETKTSSLDVTKISNTTIPKVYETTFSPDGQIFIARFLGDNLDDIKTYSAVLKPRVATTTSNSATSTISVVKINPEEANLQDVVGKYLDLNIREIAYSPSKKNLLSLFAGGDGGSIVLSDITGSNKKTLYASALREWLLSFPTEKTAVISTKPSGFALGVAYTLNTTTGLTSKIVGGLPGLTVLSSRNLAHILIGLGNNSLTTRIAKFDDVGSTAQVINTIPEKCVWAKKDDLVVYCAIPKSIPRGVYPDDWYKGDVTLNDDVWKINVKSGISSLVVSPTKEVGQDIDVINIDISSTDNYLTFINKKDLTLWGYDITDEVNLKIVVATSTPSVTTSTPKTSTTTKNSI